MVVTTPGESEPSQFVLGGETVVMGAASLADLVLLDEAIVVLVQLIEPIHDGVDILLLQLVLVCLQ